MKDTCTLCGSRTEISQGGISITIEGYYVMSVIRHFICHHCHELLETEVDLGYYCDNQGRKIKRSCVCILILRSSRKITG